MMSNAEFRISAARAQLERVAADISKIEDILSFVQGDAIWENGANSLEKEFKQLYSTLSIIRIWLANAMETEGRIK